MFPFRKETLACAALLLVSVCVYSRGLNIHGIEYRDDEIFYYKSTQEMLATHNYLSPKYFGEDRFQKPILYYWLIIFSYIIFGVHWFGARIVAVLFAGLSVCLTWLLGKRLFRGHVAGLGAVVLMTVPLFFRHAKNAVPDMALNFFIVLAVYYAVGLMQATAGGVAARPASRKDSSRYSVLFFIACGVGFMIKGFAALIVPSLTVLIYGIATRNGKFLSYMRFGRGLLILGLIICPWFLYMVHLHGWGYLEYMLIQETRDRLVANSAGNIVLRQAADFFKHIGFYTGVLGTYFAPWSVFLIVGLPWAFRKIWSGGDDAEGVRLMVIWFFVVFLFFSVISFAINHYLLVLSTPFALLISFTLLENFDRKTFSGSVLNFLRTSFFIFVFTAGFIAYCFLFVFLAGASLWWLPALLAGYWMLVRKMITSPAQRTAPFIFGVFLVFVYAQSSLLSQSGLTAHATLQKFARTIQREIQANPAGKAVIGVGSHDIHEKEFQVYFDQRVEKAAGSTSNETQAMLNHLFLTREELYCLITEQDYSRHLQGAYLGSLETIQEEFIVRKRFNLDSGFFLALLKLDQQKVSAYMTEKLVLVRKKPGA